MMLRQMSRASPSPEISHEDTPEVTAKPTRTPGLTPHPSSPSSSLHTPNSKPHSLPPPVPGRFRTPAGAEGQAWRDWPLASVKLRGLPRGVTVHDLHNNFSDYGNVVYMEIYEGQRRFVLGEARIRFEPPPEDDFWRTGYHLLTWGEDAASTEIRIELEPPRHRFPGLVRSHVNPRVFYKAKMTLPVQSLDWGPSRTGSNIMVKKTLRSTAKRDNPMQIKMLANLNRRELVVFFALMITAPSGGDTDIEITFLREFKIVIDFCQLRELSLRDVGQEDNRQALLTIPLALPPVYYFKDKFVVASTWEAGKLQWADTDQWIRTTYIFDDQQIAQDFSVGLITKWNSPNFIDIGRWTTLRFHVDYRNGILQDFLDALHGLNIDIKQHDTGREVEDAPCLLPLENVPVRHKHLFLPDSSSADDAHGLSLLSESPDQTVTALPFELHYQLEVCISRGVFNEFLLNRDFFSRIRQMETWRAKYMLEYCGDEGKRIADPMSIFNNDEAKYYYPKMVIPRHCAVIRKVLVTPTTLHYNAPTVEASNRVIRQYFHLQDRFLRVQFVDELYRGRVKSQTTIQMDFHIYRRIFHTLVNGIRIGDRHYKFLAFGNSQVRECGAWFFCETDQVTCQNMRDWMGDFDHIRVVAKCAARIGQCFSTTRQIQGIRTPRIVRIDDVEKNGFCFTDGVGKISEFFAHVIVQEMGIELRDTPTAFQFRMGGCKGVLAVWPDVKMMEVQVRKSQEKFKASFNGLEIIRMARHSIAYLNRQMITILSCLGITPNTFISLVDDQLSSYERAMRSPEAAAGLLGTYVDENQTALVLKDAINSGFMDPDIQEPFVMTILQLWRSWSMKLLKEKARVNIEKGAFVIGCVDETRTLRGHSNVSEGKMTSRDLSLLPQIFLQIPDIKAPGKWVPVTGVCLIGRNPSLHPGDIRLVEAVDCPRLRHLKGVVVFPIIGDRDVPSMLAGGDLDGDEFFVIWEPSLIPPEWNYPPMDYQQPKPPVLDRDVNHHDLAQFFVKYIRNDCLPFIALNHLANSDSLPGGAKSPTCVKLAALHSKAVDFVKTGEPAVLAKDLRAREWPHFMGGNRRIYHSGTALGQIYDRVEGLPFTPLYQNKFDKRILAKYTLEHDMLKKVRSIKTQYDTAMRRLMAQREVESEFEVWSGFILSKPRVGNGYKAAEEIGREASVLKQHFRELIQKEAGGSHIDIIGPWVAAMYKVTEEEVKIALYRRQRAQSMAGDTLPRQKRNPKGMPLISFPWVFHAQLGYIATGHWQRNIYVDHTMGLEKLEIVDVVDVNDSGERTSIMLSSRNQGRSAQEGCEQLDLSSGDEEPNGLEKLDANRVNFEGSFSAMDREPLSDEVIDEADLAGLDVAHLPDGTVIHRGQVLHLFDGDSDDEYSRTKTQDEEKSSTHAEPEGLTPKIFATPNLVAEKEQSDAETRDEAQQVAEPIIPKQEPAPPENEDPFAAIFAMEKAKMRPR